MRRVVLCVFAGTVAAACGDSYDPTPSADFATVTLVYRASTSARTDLPASAQACAQGATPTHTHPSWRSFVAVPLQAVPPDRWQVVFTDVPVGVVVSLRVNDPNACDENATGAVTRNIFANDVLLTTAVTTPGSGPEPGFSFTVTAQGEIRP
jgi:hypothetical protein